MHTYGHKWACQLVYNLCIIEGLGLTDGEGTERLWSCFIKLISIEQSSSIGHWVFHNRSLTPLNFTTAMSSMADWQASWGCWHSNGIWLRSMAEVLLEERCPQARQSCSEDPRYLCSLYFRPLISMVWTMHRPVVHLHTWDIIAIGQSNSCPNVTFTDVPVRLKKELDTVLVLQAELDASDWALQTTYKAIFRDHQTSLALDALDSMERTHVQLIAWKGASPLLIPEHWRAVSQTPQSQFRLHKNPANGMQSQNQHTQKGNW